MRLLARLRQLVDRHSFAADALLALAIAAFVQLDIWTSWSYFTAPRWIYVTSGLLMTLPLAWRRRAPLTVNAVVMGALVFESLAVGSAPTPDSPLVAWLLAIYSVAVYCERREALLGGAISLAAGTVWIGIDDVFFPIVVFGGAWIAGRLVRQRHVYARAVEDRATAVERAREADARAAAAEERARIARELHDILSHSISVMVVQAGAERLALGSVRADTAKALATIEETGRQALAEMRRLLGVLRRDEALPWGPQPTIDDLGELMSQMCEAGLRVDLRIEGEAVALPPAVSLSAYRILQEALTNVLRHAGTRDARVLVGYGTRDLVLEIADDGLGARDANKGPGHGLVGMRERAALCGGELEAGSQNSSGFVVRARLPIEPVPA